MGNITFEVPLFLDRFTDGVKIAKVNGNTVGECLDDFVRQFPNAKKLVDLVLVDCPPSLGILTMNAFAAANGLLVPLQCEYYAMEGLGQLLKTIRLIKQSLNPNWRSQESCSPCSTAETTFHIRWPMR
jgi:cellulose biosynthesis protein BcsQ